MLGLSLREALALGVRPPLVSLRVCCVGIVKLSIRARQNKSAERPIRHQSSAASLPRVALSLREALPWGSSRLPAAVVVVGVSSAASLPRVALSLWEALPWGSSRLPAAVVVVRASNIAHIPRYIRGLGAQSAPRRLGR